MDTEIQERDCVSVGMTAFEAYVCRAALREVLYGFKFPDFDGRMGCSRAEAAAVMQALPDPSTEEIDASAPPREALTRE